MKKSYKNVTDHQTLTGYRVSELWQVGELLQNSLTNKKQDYNRRVFSVKSKHKTFTFFSVHIPAGDYGCGKLQWRGRPRRLAAPAFPIVRG